MRVVVLLILVYELGKIIKCDLFGPGITLVFVSILPGNNLDLEKR